jgi:hypothetical protein
MKTMQARIAQDRITADAVMTGAAPDWATDWTPGTNWYNVTLRFQRRTMTVPFGMGPAHTSAPVAEDVLSCLTSDASSFASANGFEDWAGDYGYDTDSRKAEQTYHRVESQTAALRRFLGAKFDAYVFETESN